MNKPASDTPRYMKPILAGMIVGIVITAVFLMLSALVMTSRDIPVSATSVMALGSGLAGALCGGYVSARLTGEKGLFFGALCGGILCVILLISSTVLMKGLPGTRFAVNAVALVVAGAIGGILGVNQKKRK
ncbi:MAG TPA: TIGR04086 family membrane protein [Firmicutes bacterium]|nr:TIGR04086 family membrane protein [Bacillota bacterium]